MMTHTQAQFVERALEVGVDHESSEFGFIGGGVAIFDMDNDDLPDLFLTGGLFVDKLYRNTGSGFERIINYLHPEDFGYYDYSVSGVSVGDINNDGFDDLFLSTYLSYENLLLVNNGDYTFDVIPSDSSGITGMKWSVGASFGDVNEDGLLDIFVQSYTEVPGASVDPVTGEVDYTHIGFLNDLYINLGNARFEERSAQYGIDETGNTLTSCFTDYDNDGDVDLYVVNDFGAYTFPNELYRNEFPAASMTDVSSASNMDIGIFGMGVAIGDYDADMDLDYYVTNIGKNALMQNNGDGTFTDRSDDAGVADSATVGGFTVGWGTGFFDMDNDGDLDLYCVNGYIPAANEYNNPEAIPDVLFRNNGDGTFEEVGAAFSFNDPAVFRGAAFGDLDNDGLLDIVKVVTHRGENPPHPSLRRRAAVLYNADANGGNWIKFRLHGVESNRNGYGSHIQLYDSEGGVHLRECDGGSSHASSNSSVVHFGLGTASVDSVVILWPRGRRQTILGPLTGQLHHVTESSGSVISSVFPHGRVPAFSLFPNPARGEIRVSVQGSESPDGLQYRLVDLQGSDRLSGSMNASDLRLDISSLAAGTYMLILYNGKTFLGARRVIRMN